MNINSFEKAVEIRDQIKAIDFQLSLLSDNENDDYIVSYYDLTTGNEYDGNIIDPNNDSKKINTYKITGDLKNIIKEELFNQKSKLEEEFSLL